MLVGVDCEEKDASAGGQLGELLEEEEEDILMNVEDGGEQLYQWGRQWEKAAAKTRGDEWIQVKNIYPKSKLLTKEPIMRNAFLFFRLCPYSRKLLWWAINVPQKGCAY